MNCGIPGCIAKHGHGRPKHVHPEGTFSIVEVADMLDVTDVTIWRFVTTWYDRIGSDTGRSYDLTPVDVLVARAWHELNGRDCWRLRRFAEDAIRSEPRQWLLVTDEGATTYASAADAAQAWTGLLRHDNTLLGRVIDLVPPLTFIRLALCPMQLTKAAMAA